jgi:hypothetical protein
MIATTPLVVPARAPLKDATLAASALHYGLAIIHAINDNPEDRREGLPGHSSARCGRF